jgi:hypothetical protein
MYAAIRAFQRRHELACSKRVVSCESQAPLDRCAVGAQPANARGSGGCLAAKQRKLTCHALSRWRLWLLRRLGRCDQGCRLQRGRERHRALGTSAAFRDPTGLGGLPHSGGGSLSRRSRWKRSRNFFGSAHGSAASPYLECRVAHRVCPVCIRRSAL